MYIDFIPNRHQASPALLIGLPPLPVQAVPQIDRDIGPKGEIFGRGARPVSACHRLEQRDIHDHISVM